MNTRLVPAFALTALLGSARVVAVPTEPTASPVSATAPQPSLLAQIDSLVEAERIRQQIPGVAIAVVHHGSVLVAKGYGLANVEHEVPVTAETLFQAGSLGKQLTAAVAMTLVEEGKLALDDPVTRFLPAAPTAWQPITIRHLLTHTSGITDWDEPLVDLRRDYSDEEFDRIIFAQQLEFPAGSRFNYTNTGYDLLGQILQKITGQTLATLYRERLFKPAGIRTARVISEADIVPHRAAGYETADGILKNQRWVAPSLNETMASGCLYVSVLDLVAWDKTIRERSVLTPESWATIFTPVRLNSGKTYPYGFGWFIEEVAGQTVHEHTGRWQGFNAFMVRYLGDDLTIIVLANSAGARLGRITNGVARLFNPALADWAPVPVERSLVAGDPPAIPDREPEISRRLHNLITSAAAGTLSPSDFGHVPYGFLPGDTEAYHRLLAGCGSVREIILVGRREMGDDVVYRFTLRFAAKRFAAILKLEPDGKVAGLRLDEIAPGNSCQVPPPTSTPAFVHPPGELITVNGAKLWVESVGAGKPILVIAGGPGCSHGYLHPSFDALAATHRVIYFDAFGRGKSDRATAPTEYTFDRDVNDVVGLIEALKLGPVTVLGHSYGTVVAQAVALQHPGAVGKLVLVAPYHSAGMWQASNDYTANQLRIAYPDEWRQLAELRDRGLRSSTAAYVEVSEKIPVWLQTMYFDASNDAKLDPVFEFDGSVFAAIAGDDADFTLGGSLAGFDFRPKLKDLAMPTLILAGRADGGAQPRFTLQYRQFAPRAKFVLFERSGHQPFLEESELALATLRAFLVR